MNQLKSQIHSRREKMIGKTTLESPIALMVMALIIIFTIAISIRSSQGP